MTSCDCDLAVIGAGLAGTALLATLHQAGWHGSATVLEAGRGPGGRASTRWRRGCPSWRLDHGAPLLHLPEPSEGPLTALVAALVDRGALKREEREVVLLGEEGLEGDAPAGDGFGALGTRWRGQPAMEAVAATLLELAGPAVVRRFGVRVQRLCRVDPGWDLLDQHGERLVRARVLVLSGNLLAHPRSLSLLGVPGLPLREAIPQGDDPRLDQALERIALMRMEPRWNRMLELPRAVDGAEEWPYCFALSPSASARWQLDRLVLQPQKDGRVGLVAHGLTPQVRVDPELLSPWPSLVQALTWARDLGVMRWGAARPLDHPLPAALQWCPASSLGFCGDWIDGPGFGLADGALRSAVDLAARLLQTDALGQAGAGS
ncbi:MAG: NAD(P)-binding protein [Synechococcus sp.]|nr:NAD(P)-binding protein [Synechococcus sp.]